MNDQIKKQTNLGIVLAVIGFTMVGGALVLVPRLVDEKVKSIQSLEDSQNTLKTGGEETAASARSGHSNGPAQPAANGKKEGDGDGGAGKSASVAVASSGNSNEGKKPADSAASSKTSLQASENGPWELVLVDKYEPDDASRTRLDAIVAMMKATPGVRLKVVGMNNINKMSRLAQIGANRISNTIIKNAGIAPERIETEVAQQPDMTDIRVKISVVGGAQ